jgi:hypothetical protein
MGRRIVVGNNDVLVVGGLELDGDVLRSIIDADRRLLWTFVKEPSGDVRPVCYSEEQVVWLTARDLARDEAPNEV